MLLLLQIKSQGIITRKVPDLQLFLTATRPLPGLVVVPLAADLESNMGLASEITSWERRSPYCASGTISRSGGKTPAEGSRGLQGRKHPGQWLHGIVQRKASQINKETKQKSDWSSQIRPHGEAVDRHAAGGQTQEPEWKEFLKSCMPAVKTGRPPAAQGRPHLAGISRDKR